MLIDHEDVGSLGISYLIPQYVWFVYQSNTIVRNTRRVMIKTTLTIVTEIEGSPVMPFIFKGSFLPIVIMVSSNLVICYFNLRYYH